MDISRKLVWNLYAGGIAALTAVVTKKGLDAGWKSVTGHEPPEVNDPATPPAEALAWARASLPRSVAAWVVSPTARSNCFRFTVSSVTVGLFA